MRQSEEVELLLGKCRWLISIVTMLKKQEKKYIFRARMTLIVVQSGNAYSAELLHVFGYSQTLSPAKF